MATLPCNAIGTLLSIWTEKLVDSPGPKLIDPTLRLNGPNMPNAPKEPPELPARSAITRLNVITEVLAGCSFVPLRVLLLRNFTGSLSEGFLTKTLTLRGDPALTATGQVTVTRRSFAQATSPIPKGEKTARIKIGINLFIA